MYGILAARRAPRARPHEARTRALARRRGAPGDPLSPAFREQEVSYASLQPLPTSDNFLAQKEVVLSFLLASEAMSSGPPPLARSSARASDVVLGAAFDHYAQRLAVCSADGVVRIFERGGSGGGGLSAAAAASSAAAAAAAPGGGSDAWRQHSEGFSPGSGAVWRVSWAHPEFGQVVAVCGAATTTSVYEEAEAPDAAGRVVSRWTRKAELGDARAQVNDCEFAPRHQGLRLATGSQDGLVRVYEVADVLNLTHWPLADEFRGARELEGEAALAAHAHGGGGSAVTCLAWCSSPFDVPMMVVGGARGEVVVGALGSSSRKWARRAALRRHEGARVNDVAWAPSVGRAHHLVASGGGGTLCLWRVQQEESEGAAAAAAEEEEEGAGSDVDGDGSGGGAAAEPSNDARASVVRLDGSTAAAARGGTRHLATFQDGSVVWRCDFNVLGTVLASVGEDGVLRMRRADLAGRWAVVASLETPESADAPRGE
jgi:nucleoporin SEH1